MPPCKKKSMTLSLILSVIYLHRIYGAPVEASQVVDVLDIAVVTDIGLVVIDFVVVMDFLDTIWIVVFKITHHFHVTEDALYFLDIIGSDIHCTIVSPLSKHTKRAQPTSNIEISCALLSIELILHTTFAHLQL